MNVLRQNISNIAFITLIPGNFLYIALNSFAIIPNFLGGYSPIMMSLFFFPLAILYIKSSPFRKKENRWFDLLFFAFLMYHAIVLLSSIVFENISMEMRYYHISSILYSFVFFTIFRNLDIRSKPFNMINISAIVFMVITVLISIVDHSLLLLVNLLNTNEDAATSYQILAVIFILCSVVFISMQERVIVRIPFYLFALITLYYMGSRSEFFGYFIVIFATEFIKNKNRFFFFLIVSIVFAISIVILKNQVEQVSDNHNRILNLLIYGTQSSSALARETLFNNGLKIIADNPFFGDLNGYSKGAYIHNILSVWVDLGIFGFLFVSALLAIPLTYCLKVMCKPKYKPPPQFEILFVLILLSVFLMLFAKTYNYLPAYAAMGLFSRLFISTALN